MRLGYPCYISMKSNIFRVALVGCGAISKNHLKAVLAAKQTVAALCDINPDRARKLADAYSLGDIPIFADFDAMLETVPLDIVHICTPHNLHASMTVRALNRGIHVLCEKPLAISEEELQAVLDAERKSRAFLGVCHQNRYEPNMRKLKEITVSDPPVGGYANVVWRRDAAYYASGSWRGTKEKEGGGALINQALHTLDLMQWLFGMPNAVVAHVFNDYHRQITEVEDFASGTFEGEGSVCWQFLATTAGAGDFPIQLNLRLKSGKLLEVQNHQFMVNHRFLSGDDDTGMGKWVWGDGHRALIADFYDHLERNVPFEINGEEGAKVVRMILACYRSGGGRVTIADNRP